MKTIFLFLLFSQLAWSQKILIDPGHGGKDHGAKGRIAGTKGIQSEKNLTLKLAKILKEKLKKKYTVFLTREKDKHISLEDRAKLAEELKVDIVLSIHFNSSEYRNARGFETYYLDNHDDVAVKRLESAENHGFSEDSLVNKILIDLAIKLTSSKSKKLAKLTHQNLVKRIKGKYKIKDRGFKPGNFYVLALSKRPGLLLEAGFMSNRKELSKISNQNFFNDYAEGILSGLNAFYGK